MPKLCKHCGRVCQVPQVVDDLRTERWPLKNGKLGKERKVVRKQTLCGICFGLEYTKGDESMSDIRTELLELAQQEMSPGNGAKANGTHSNRSNGHKATAKIRVPRPTMTAQEATNFSGISLANAALVESTFECDCQAYVDIFTYKRWIAQGMQVAKGSKAVRPPRWLVVERKDRDSGEVKTIPIKIAGHSAVFCRHQVEAVTA